MNRPSEITRFWEKCCAARPDLDPATPYAAWYFCDNRECANKLAALVLAGTKRGTTCLAIDPEDDRLPVVGDVTVVTDYDGKSQCVIRLTDVQVKPFAEVDEQFAYDEGEGDRTLAYWKEAHRKFFMRRCEELKTEFSEDLEVVCQRFEVLYPLS
jgi:uncharacterized protein YhfF